MELVRLDTTDCGIVYVRADSLFSLGPAPAVEGEARTLVRFLLQGLSHCDVQMANEVDEVAAMFESACFNCSISRIE